MKEYTEEEVRLIIEGAIAAEREECAQVCFELWNKWIHEKDTIRFPDAKDCAAAIRARSNHD